MDKTFKPQSGMVFEKTNGQRGLFVKADNDLIMMTANKTSGMYDVWGIFTPEKLTQPNGIKAIYLGMLEYSHFGLNKRLANATSRSAVWRREESATKIKLNDEYIAEVSTKGIKVGCSTFPLSVARELAEAVNKVSRVGLHVMFREVKIGEKCRYIGGISNIAYVKTSDTHIENCDTGEGMFYDSQDAMFEIV